VYHHVQAVKSNNDALQSLIRRCQHLGSSVASISGGPTLDTLVCHDALASIYEDFSSTNVELDRVTATRRRDGVRRVIMTREVQAVLDSLLCRLRHIDLQVFNLDGFANVGNLVDADKSLVIEDLQSLCVRDGKMFAGRRRLEQLIQSRSAGLASVTTGNDALNQLLEAVERI
jgi:hypothetical protein